MLLIQCKNLGLLILHIEVGRIVSSSDSRNTMKHDVIGGGKFKYMKEMSKTY